MIGLGSIENIDKLSKFKVRLIKKWKLENQITLPANVNSKI